MKSKKIFVPILLTAVGFIAVSALVAWLLFFRLEAQAKKYAANLMGVAPSAVEVIKQEKFFGSEMRELLRVTKAASNGEQPGYTWWDGTKPESEATAVDSLCRITAVAEVNGATQELCYFMVSANSVKWVAAPEDAQLERALVALRSVNAVANRDAEAIAAVQGYDLARAYAQDSGLRSRLQALAKTDAADAAAFSTACRDTLLKPHAKALVQDPANTKLADKLDVTVDIESIKAAEATDIPAGVAAYLDYNLGLADAYCTVQAKATLLADKTDKNGEGITREEQYTLTLVKTGAQWHLLPGPERYLEESQ
ncbi:MAG: hypothetical protein LBC83_00875 [Oscillospiraceae bacterium]|jgi:hypothetical protein|nr:hypothetical protein [Oscillospiraceae bacterium]